MLWPDYLTQTNEIFTWKIGAQKLYEFFFKIVFSFLETQWHRFLIFHLMWNTLYDSFLFGKQIKVKNVKNQRAKRRYKTGTTLKIQIRAVELRFQLSDLRYKVTNTNANTHSHTKTKTDRQTDRQRERDTHTHKQTWRTT